MPGPSGAPGQPPASWTFTYGSTGYTCTRTVPFDPASPQYTCAGQQTATPSPSESKPHKH